MLEGMVQDMRESIKLIDSLCRLKVVGVYVAGGRDKRAKNSPAVNK